MSMRRMRFAGAGREMLKANLVATEIIPKFKELQGLETLTNQDLSQFRELMVIVTRLNRLGAGPTRGQAL